MKPSEALHIHRETIRALAAECHVLHPRIFGSVLHGDDTEKSDLDLLVDPTPQTTLFDIARLQWRLQKLLHVSVDVLTPKALPIDFRDQVLQEAVLI